VGYEKDKEQRASIRVACGTPGTNTAILITCTSTGTATITSGDRDTANHVVYNKELSVRSRSKQHTNRDGPKPAESTG